MKQPNEVPPRHNLERSLISWSEFSASGVGGGMERSNDADGNAQTCRKFTTTSAVNEQNVGSHLSGADALDPIIGYLAEK